MSVMPDSWIIEMAEQHGMISPFIKEKVSSNVLSYGVSSYGYDPILDTKFKVFTNVSGSQIIDPKNFSDINCVAFDVDELIIPSNGFVLASTIEKFKIPRDIITICLGKSTYARCGLIVNVTPLEPEWEGNITIEISNTAPLPVKIYAKEGICQLIFFKADSQYICKKSYKDKDGKYMNQQGIEYPIVQK